MTSPTRWLRALALVLLSLLLLAACQPNYEIPAMTPEENQAIDTLTARMTPRCVGHYLIDLPEGFVINPITTTKLEGVDITIEPMERNRFNSVLKARHEALKTERIMGEETASLLSATPLSDGAGYVFNRSRTGAEATIRTLELMAWRSGSQITVLSDATDMSLDTDPMVCDIRKTDVPDKLARLLNVYERVRGRADLEVPAEQGICFANGFLRGEPNDKEEVNLYYHLATEKDCLIAAWPLKST